MDFDQHASSYDESLARALGPLGADVEAYAMQKARLVRRMLDRAPRSMLEFGCGIGNNIGPIRTLFPGTRISGCDISGTSLGVASAGNADCDFFLSTPEELAKRRGSFDAVLAVNVFHHIEPARRSETVMAVAGLLGAGGRFILIEHNPKNPITRRVVRDCVWDADAVLIDMREAINLMGCDPFRVVSSAYTLFFPGPLRALEFLEPWLKSIPVGGQYAVMAEKHE